MNTIHEIKSAHERIEVPIISERFASLQHYFHIASLQVPKFSLKLDLVKTL